MATFDENETGPTCCFVVTWLLIPVGLPGAGRQKILSWRCEDVGW
ncbi:hypothetical protein O9992_14370 [Vibrio lentus]|nr:hypothetical protein [Vibrio lentus]